VYDGDELVITVQYQLYLLQHSCTTFELLECPSKLLQNLIQRTATDAEETFIIDSTVDDKDMKINEDDEFAMNGLLYCNNYVLAKCIYPI
jgi:hypothetical protein